MRKLLILTFLLATLTMATRAAPAPAKYDPAPTYLTRAASQSKAPKRGTLERRAWIVCKTWKRKWERCRRVLNVAWCEDRLSPSDLSGAYKGTFQFDEHNVKTYGLGRTMWSQAKAALELWKDRHWAPWSCKPR